MNKWTDEFKAFETFTLQVVTLEINDVEIKSKILDDIEARQQEDFSKIFKALNDQKSPNHELVTSQYRIIDGILHKHGSFRVDSKVPLLICVPKSDRQHILDAYHVDNLSNHRNANDLALKILQTFYWPGLHKDARNYVKNCQVCIRSKTRVKKLPYAQHKDIDIMDTMFNKGKRRE